MTDWRELERERVASGVPIARPSWVCTHAKGRRAPEMPQQARTPNEGQRMFGHRALTPYRDMYGRWTATGDAA